MTDRDRRNDWAVIGAVALIALGAWLLLGTTLGPWFGPVRDALRFASKLVWPLMLIALGVLLLMTARSGGFAGRAGRTGRLYRSRTDRMVGGVLAGVADYLDMDPTLVRIVYAVIAVIVGFFPALVVYIIAMVIVPEQPDANTAVVEPPQWPSTSGSSRPTHPSGWPTTGTESVQTPPPPPAPKAPEPPAGG